MSLLLALAIGLGLGLLIVLLADTYGHIRYLLTPYSYPTWRQRSGRPEWILSVPNSPPKVWGDTWLTFLGLQPAR